MEAEKGLFPESKDKGGDPSLGQQGHFCQTSQVVEVDSCRSATTELAPSLLKVVAKKGADPCERVSRDMFPRVER